MRPGPEDPVLLSQQYCKLFAEHDVKVGISIDGDRAANDRHRRYADGHRLAMSHPAACRCLLAGSRHVGSDGRLPQPNRYQLPLRESPCLCSDSAGGCTLLSVAFKWPAISFDKCQKQNLSGSYICLELSPDTARWSERSFGYLRVASHPQGPLGSHKRASVAHTNSQT